MSELLRKVKETGEAIESVPISPQALGELIRFIEDGTISGKMAKDIFDTMYETGGTPQEIIEKEGLSQISDPSALRAVARQVVLDNPKQAAQYRAGKTKIFGWLVGQVMKATQGKANPQLARDAIRGVLEENDPD